MTGLVNHDQRSKRHYKGQGAHWEFPKSVNHASTNQYGGARHDTAQPPHTELQPSSPGGATIGHVIQEVYGATSDLPLDTIAFADEQLDSAVASITEVGEGSLGLAATNEHLSVAHDQLTTASNHLAAAHEKLTAYLLEIS